jgi:hypothetical protein
LLSFSPTAIASSCGMAHIGELVAAEQQRLEHAYDRAIIAAVWRRYRAASGLGFQFQAPQATRGSS